MSQHRVPPGASQHSHFAFAQSNTPTSSWQSTTGASASASANPSQYDLHQLSASDAYGGASGSDVDINQLIDPSSWALDAQHSAGDDYDELDASISAVLKALDEDEDEDLYANVRINKTTSDSASAQQQQLYDDRQAASGWENAPPQQQQQQQLDQQQQLYVDHDKTSSIQTESTDAAVAPITPAPATAAPAAPHLYIPLGRRNFTHMSRSELAAVIKSQLNQMQPSDILADDFYYQVYTARKGGKVATFSNVLPLIHARQTLARPDLQSRFANALGRVELSNIHKPKRLMNIVGGTSEQVVTVPSAAGPARKNLFAGRSIPYLIEESIRVLMEIEDVDSLLSSEHPPEERNALMYRRHQLVEAVADSLDMLENPVESADTDHLVFTFARLPKGRLLLFRALLLMGAPFTSQLIAILLIDIYVLVEVLLPSPSDDRLVSVVCDAAYASDIPISIDLFRRFVSAPSTAEHIVEILRCKLGALLTQVFLKKGHEIHTHLVNAKQQNAPNQIVHAIEHDYQTWQQYFQNLVTQLDGKYAQLLVDLPRADARSSILRRTKTTGKLIAIDRKTNTAKLVQSETPTGAAAAGASESTSTRPLATVSVMFELFAALLSHATTAQRATIVPQIAKHVDDEVKVLTAEPFTTPLSNAMRFLFTLIHPDQPAPAPVEPIVPRPIPHTTLQQQLAVQSNKPSYASAMKAQATATPSSTSATAGATTSNASVGANVETKQPEQQQAPVLSELLAASPVAPARANGKAGARDNSAQKSARGKSKGSSQKPYQQQKQQQQAGSAGKPAAAAIPQYRIAQRPVQ